MNPIDYRNETWTDVKARVHGLRQQVYQALQQHGPCTTRVLADKSGIDLLSVRPRVTELVQLGLAELHNPEPGAGEGTYRAIGEMIALLNFQKRQREMQNAQMPLL